MNWMAKNWNSNPEQESYYRSQGVDGTKCSFLNYLNTHGFYCPEAVDAVKGLAGILKRVPNNEFLLS